MIISMILYHLQLKSVFAKQELCGCAIIKYVMAVAYLAVLITTAVTNAQPLIDNLWSTLIVFPVLFMFYSYILFNGKCLHSK